LAGTLWIAASDATLRRFFPDPAIGGWVGFLKGLCFVAFTAVLLWRLLARHFAEIRESTRRLVESEQRLRMMGDSLPDGYVYEYVWHPDGTPRFCQVSAGVERLHGISAADVLRDPQTLWRQIDPAQLDALRAAEAASARSLSDFGMDLRFQAADGAWHLIHLQSRPRREPSGLVRWQGLAVDLTARHRAEEALRERELILAEVGRMASIGGWGLDPATGAGGWTDEVARIHDLDPQIKPNLSMGLTFYTPESRRIIEPAVQAAIAAGVPYDLELELVSAKGVRKWVRTICWPVTGGGRVVRLRGAIQDITEAHQAAAALRESRARLAAALGSMTEAVFISDTEGHFVEFNDAFATFHRFKNKAECLGRLADYPAILEVRTPDGALLPLEQWAVPRALRGETAMAAEFHLRRKETGESWIGNYSFAPIRDAQGRVVGAVVVGRDVTEARRTERALLESEREFRTMFEVVTIGMAEAEPATGRLLRVNARMCADTGYPENELVGRSFLDITYPDDRQRDWGFFVRLAEGPGREYHFEKRYLRKNGSVMWASINLSILRDESGRAVRSLAAIEDISQRKETERALRESERAFRATFELVSIGLAQADPITARFLRVNARMCTITGYSSEELLERSFTDLTHPEERAASRRRFGRLLAGETPEYTVEKRYLRKDGSLAWVNVNVNLIRDEAGRPIHTLATVEDITQRKRVEERLRQLSRAVEQSPVSIIITDLSGIIGYVNPRFEEVSGYRAVEVLGKTPRILKSGETHDDTYRDLWHTITGGREWQGEFHNRRKNGELYWERAAISPITDDQGRITHFLAVKEDITARRLLEAQLGQAQKLEAVAQLAGGVAHDFNNLLGAILIQIALLRDDSALRPDLRDGVRELEQEAHRAVGLIRQLLVFSRRSVLNPAVLNLNSLIENLIKMLRRLIGEHIDARFQPCPDLPSVRADAGMIEQVLMNLVLNARDAMPGGGVLEISLAPRHLTDPAALVHPESRIGRFVCLSVSDTGCGMDSETIKRAFDPFFTTKGPGRGTGLGLATVHGIVGQHEGWIEMQSEVGVGSAFHVFLPAEDAAPEPEATEELVALASLGGSERILVVEDDPALLRGLGQLLQGLGYHLQIARDALEAAAVWEREREHLDLLLADWVIPGGKSGPELGARFQAERPDLKVIISSGYTGDQTREQAATGLNFVYLPKPCDPWLMASTIRAALEGTNGRPLRADDSH